jgi:D-alanyl-D-alanine dipeptidase
VIGLAVAALLAGAEPSPAPELVDVTSLVPDAVLDLRYARADNLAGRALYPARAPCLLARPVAERLARAARRLREAGLRIVLWDCFRPTSAQAELWRAMPRPGAVADPARGSNHSRGAAVDLSLAGADGEPLAMPTAFDAFGPAAHPDATEGIPGEVRQRRDLLLAALSAEGFAVHPREWWHFAAREAERYPLRDDAWP